jgi:hypothetical protein
VVSRKIDVRGEAIQIKLTPSDMHVGHTWLECRILLPVAKAHKLKEVLMHQHNVEKLRREGRSEEDIAAILAQAAEDRRNRELDRQI